MEQAPALELLLFWSRKAMRFTKTMQKYNCSGVLIRWCYDGRSSYTESSHSPVFCATSRSDAYAGVSPPMCLDVFVLELNTEA